ncbi:MAG TPA: hypothetical protein EYP56_05630, partial [Planctomycetaceae bacterium]|nr:hypothetical protein [Planctomycetaceae bacterium]
MERRELGAVRPDARGGCSMQDLLDAARDFGLDAHFQRLSWQELTQLDGCAILWTGGNHFIAVDPREAA